MLTNEFCVRGKFLVKRVPHSFTPPLSVVGVSNRFITDFNVVFITKFSITFSTGFSIECL
jgi:hypothetical protein